jgi:excisionase family DNA binding protein
MHPHEYGLTKATYTVNETLGLLSIGRTKLYQLIEAGDLIPIKIGTKTLLPSPEIAAFLNKRREAAKSELAAA